MRDRAKTYQSGLMEFDRICHIQEKTLLYIFANNRQGALNKRMSGTYR